MVWNALQNQNFYLMLTLIFAITEISMVTWVSTISLYV